MTKPLYDPEGYMIVPGIEIEPLPLVVQNCNGIELTCDDRDYWLPAWRVVDARPGTYWPIGGPKGREL